MLEMDHSVEGGDYICQALFLAVGETHGKNRIPAAVEHTFQWEKQGT